VVAFLAVTPVAAQAHPADIAHRTVRPDLQPKIDDGTRELYIPVRFKCA
jgi:hypothetical protein